MSIRLLYHELKMNVKSMLIWSVSVGILGLVCILIFDSMEGDIAGMAEQFSELGSFADAVGMSKLSIATLEGYYATEIGTIYCLGGAMFAAIMGIGMLSKEEEGHTSEFLFSLPVSRRRLILTKYVAVMINIMLFTVICMIIFWAGIKMMDGEFSGKLFITYHLMQLLMDMEIASICFSVSAFVRKNMPGVGIGIVLALYFTDMIGRIGDSLDHIKFLNPYSYSNAADIFAAEKLFSAWDGELKSIVVGILATIVAFVAAAMQYDNKDLAA